MSPPPCPGTLPHARAFDRSVPLVPTPEDVFAEIERLPGASWLDGGRGDRGWTILAWDPADVVASGRDWPAVGRRMTRDDGDPAVPFTGGVLGYVGYEAGFRVERVPAARPTPEPEVWLARYDGGLCYRHADGTWHAGGSPGFVRDARALLSRARPLPAPPPATPGRVRTVPRDVYEARVRRVLDYVAAGDCYQVNLSRPVWREDAGEAFAAYRRLRRLANAAYGGFLRLADDLAILSSSPELLLDVRGRTASSLPIKGTRPRHPDPVVDHALRNDLLRSEKDKAELTMIVDLVRNDLGRVAAPGGVRWDVRKVTAHANVHHAAWRVDADLRDGLDAWDALAAVFPPGSVTGAPKVRACERIAELEDAPRGVYCGAIGYAADGGDATFNVAIRTAVWHAGAVRWHVGGGVVADSDPAAEWDETVAKGTAMARAFGAEGAEALALSSFRAFELDDVVGGDTPPTALGAPKLDA